MDEIGLEDRHFEEATRRGNAERNLSPIHGSVRVDIPSSRIVVEITNGSAFMFPARSSRGLEAAIDDQLSNVTLLGETGLHWEALDVDYSIRGLLNGVFGTSRFMEVNRRGGRSRKTAG